MSLDKHTHASHNILSSTFFFKRFKLSWSEETVRKRERKLKHSLKWRKSDVTGTCNPITSSSSYFSSDYKWSVKHVGELNFNPSVLKSISVRSTRSILQNFMQWKFQMVWGRLETRIAKLSTPWHHSEISREESFDGSEERIWSFFLLP